MDPRDYGRGTLAFFFIYYNRLKIRLSHNLLPTLSYFFNAETQRYKGAKEEYYSNPF